MPCYSVTTTSIDFAKANVPMLLQAFIKLGYAAIMNGKNIQLSRPSTGHYGQFNAETGKIEIRGRSEVDEGEIKRTYAAVVIEQTTKRFGWTAKQVTATKFIANKRA